MPGRDDPRRRTSASNPLARYERNDSCWCGSGRKYKACHLIRGLSSPGAAVPTDTDDAVFISPNTSVAKGAFSGNGSDIAFTMQHPRPQATPVRVDEAVRVLAAEPSSDMPLSHIGAGRLRYGILEAHGLTDLEALREGRRDAVLGRVLPELARGVLSLARQSFERLALDTIAAQRPVVLRLDSGDPAAFVGQTLFWADHYLTHDHLAALAVSETDDVDTWRQAICKLLELRPLIEAGLVVPVFDDLALAALNTAIDGIVEVDLAHQGYVEWAEQQVVLEGPTAREAAFVYVIDDYEHQDWFYMLGRTIPGSPRQPDADRVQFSSKLLNHYDPNHDYGPWLGTVRRQAVAQLTKELDSHLLVTRALGADLVTSSPFRARALRRRSAHLPRAGDYDISGAVWADVPWLPNAPADLLVKIAADEPRVDELRRATAGALKSVADDALAAAAQSISDAAGELNAAGERLGRGLRKQAFLDTLAPTGLSVGSVLVAGTLGMPLLASGVLAGAASLLPATRGAAAARRTAPYAFWMASPRSRR